MTRRLLAAAGLALSLSCSRSDTLAGPKVEAPPVCLDPAYSIAGHADTCMSCFESCAGGPQQLIPCRPDQKAVLDQLRLTECPR